MSRPQPSQIAVLPTNSEQRLDLTPQWLRRIWLTGDSLRRYSQALQQEILAPARVSPQEMWEIKHHMLMHEKLMARPVPELNVGRIVERYA
ncbi:hypothetical protein [Desulfonatronospira sp.]|uniref:hypothetical protein n=1 Tax=Desulfonatronospira sp. TaxID=1962951 RepID=UPI0025C06935|nr:hypothetical protein [Desulfonatronospira sp.]